MSYPSRYVVLFETLEKLPFHACSHPEATKGICVFDGLKTRCFRLTGAVLERGCMHAVHFVPRLAFLTCGAGRGTHSLIAFDAALRDAGVAGQNLVPVSSVFPPNCELVSRDVGLAMLASGQVTFCVMARQETCAQGTSATAAIGLALPKDERQYGYLAEYHAESLSEEAAGRTAEELAVELLSVKLGVAPQAVELSRKTSVSRSATVQDADAWVSAVALCVFVFGE